ncbi:Hypothetical protein NTJ_10781 [Nesidiocoris tenuis]|uniref:Uncharacterized protein n=1 Tax=Nesidiocoris tenuis TaxID=355587 RepID=A0ABN7B485_9HEMI|nr:Hypothetical protein NTJ_10781 [Nesidiocoris tenuis]
MGGFHLQQLTVMYYHHYSSDPPTVSQDYKRRAVRNCTFPFWSSRKGALTAKVLLNIAIGMKVQSRESRARLRRGMAMDVREWIIYY